MDIMKNTLVVAACCLAHTAWSALPRSMPEVQGISSAAILDFVQSADKQVDAMNSFMLVRHGHVVAEGWWSPYAADIPHSMYSLSKSFTSTGVGLAISEGKLSLSDEVLKFFPDEAPANPSANLKEMRVRDLLRMSTGQHAYDVTNNFSFDSSEPLVKLFLSIPVAHNTSGTQARHAFLV
jgi:CubicO group peptidase (beta-lactamase class C family)